jgi:hypothetical protein
MRNGNISECTALSVTCHLSHIAAYLLSVICLSAVCLVPVIETPYGSLYTHYRDIIDLLNKRWTWQIVRLLLNDPLHFNDLKKHIDHISAQILSTRIKELMQ